MVPIKEMTDVLRVTKEQAQLKPKQWVRLKRGIYKDDLAQVRFLCISFELFRFLNILNVIKYFCFLTNQIVAIFRWIL